jgi:hypothetical protein
MSGAAGATSASDSRPSFVVCDYIYIFQPRFSFARPHTCTVITFADILRRPLLPPTLADAIDYPKSIRFRGGGHGVSLRRLAEKAPERVYCCLFSQQGQPLPPRPLQTPFLIYPTTSAGCLRRAPAWRAPPRWSPYSFNHADVRCKTFLPALTAARLSSLHHPPACHRCSGRELLPSLDSRVCTAHVKPCSCTGGSMIHADACAVALLALSPGQAVGGPTM